MERAVQNRTKALIIVAGVLPVFLFAAFWIARFYVHRDYTVTLDLKDYVSLGRSAQGEPLALLDVDAILTDLHLPSPHTDAMAEQKYPDVRALLNMQLYLSYTDDPDQMQVVVLADTATLADYGIHIDSLSWLQQLKGYVASEDVSPLPTPALPAVTPTPSPADGESQYLSALTDADGYGYNLRALCERIQRERDLLLKELFRSGESYKVEKMQVTFHTGTQDARYVNCYQACYRVTPETEDGTEPVLQYFRVRVYDLALLSDGTVGFRDNVDVTLHQTENECKRSPSSAASGVTLSGGGVRVRDRAAFDQNGFVIFPGQPTSYRMANGLYWSPTYDVLSEDMIWKLTAVDGHSLANLLRYARKEIYARYHVVFDQRTEREFFTHYNSYPWYLEPVPDRSLDMTEAEKSNIRLLREIQSLVEK